jgi:UDP-N-acetyl-2-amino-2-deoxyglucuronate dehydrogenase
MKKLKCAVIGCGVIGGTHGWGISNDSNAEIEVFCDIVPKKAQKLADQYNSKTEADWHKIISDDDIDVISIALPHHLHAEVFEAAISANKHVICEKPLCTTPKDLYKMVELSQNSEKVTACIFQHRFSAPVVAIQQFIERGFLGEIQSASGSLICKRTKEYYATDKWRGRWDMEGGGVMINQAIHTLDYLSIFLGQPNKIESNVEHRLIEGIEVEDFVDSTFYYPNGIHATFKAVNDNQTNWDVHFKLNGSLCSIELNENDLTCSKDEHIDILKEIYEKAKQSQKETLNAPGKECYGGLHNFAFSDFFECIRTGKKPIVSIESAAITNEMVLGSYHASAENKTIDLPIKNYTQPKLI